MEQELEHRHYQFIQKIVQEEKVWGLKRAEEDWAVSSSNQFINAKEQALGLLPFWSTKAKAKACAIEDWSEYKPTAILLTEFMEAWCVGIYQDELIIGVDFDTTLLGTEREALVLLLEIIDEVRHCNKQLQLTYFKNLKDLRKQAEEIVTSI